MKKLILLLLFIPLVFSCESDKDDVEDDVEPVVQNPVYLDNNGVTIKAHTWAEVGQSGEVNGITYKIVDGSTLKTMVENGDDVTRACTSRITDMSNFKFQQTFTQDIASWDVSSVTNMSLLFQYAHNFNQDISKWDVSNVINMEWMFAFAFKFNQDISIWDVSNVQNMTRMFRDASSFNQNLSSWDVGNVVNCNDLCNNATNWTLSKPNFTNDCGYTGCD